MSRPITFVTFCERTLKLQLSPAWRVLLRVAVDRIAPARLDRHEFVIARKLFGDVDEVPDSARRTHVWRLGRASGKSTIASALGVWAMLVADLSRVGIGMVPAAVVVAPTKKTARICVRVARELVRSVPSLERLVERDGDTSEGFSIRRPDGRVVAFVAVAASRGGASLRGFDIVMVVFDESEFFASNDDVATGDGYAVSDRDLFAAARPRLHGPAVFISTPWPTENLTGELVDKNHGHPHDALVAVGASTFMRPDDARLAEDVESELARDEENALREYFVQPGVRGGSKLFDPDAVDGAIVEGRPLLMIAGPGAKVGAGGDLGLERDSSAIAIVSTLNDFYELLEFDEVRPAKGAPLSPGYVIRQRFAPVMHRHGVGAVTMDAHYRQSAIEHLTDLGLSMRDAPTGNQGKYDTYMFVRALLNAGKLRIPPSARLVSQLKNITSKPIPGGLTKISSPRRAGSRGHGDVVSALVLGCYSAQFAAKRARKEHPPGTLIGGVYHYDQWSHTVTETVFRAGEQTQVTRRGYTPQSNH